MKVFSKNKFIKCFPDDYYKDLKWINECDGKEVVNNEILTPGKECAYIIADAWCEDIKEKELCKRFFIKKGG